jgi:hypothetical protein
MTEATFNVALLCSLTGIGLVILALLYDVRSTLNKILEKLESQGPAGR